MTFSELKDAIAEYAHGTASDMVTPAQDAIRWLSNHFGIEDEDKTLTGDGDAVIFAKPAGTLEIYGVLVDGEEAPRIELDEVHRMEFGADESLLRYFETDDHLNFLVAPCSGAAITVLRRKAFTVPTSDAAVLDVPDRLLDLLVSAGVVRAFRKMVSLVATSAQSLPDFSLDEIRRALSVWSDQVTDELKRM